MFKEFRFDFEDVCPDDKSLACALQVSDMNVFYDLRPVIDSVMCELYGYNGIHGGYTLSYDCEIDLPNHRIICNDTTLETGKRVTSYLKDSTGIAVFICTAGEIFTELSSVFLQKGDAAEAFIVDSVGSLVVENAMDLIHRQIETEMSEVDIHVSNRYSPGYCEWNVSGQKSLFGILGNINCGVSLTESCLMTPVKSVSGIIGLGKNVRKRAYGCNVCGSESCVYRHIRREMNNIR